MKREFTRRGFIKVAGAAALAGAGRGAFGQDGGARPNILWLSTEDIGPHLGCYGDPHAITPTIDQLAAEGIRYTHAYTVSGVCAPNRSSIITGIHATTLGTHHMRSGGEGTERSIQPELPDNIRCFPELLRDAGYYCTNNSKEDYNFSTTRRIWNESSGDAHWRNRPGADQPFFAVFNFTGSHEGSVNAGPDRHAQKTANFTEEQHQDPDVITPPPFHPNTAKVRERWAQYYENITALDYWVTDHLRELNEAGLADNTIVMFWSDHGAGMPRSKRWLYDSGVHVPVIVRFPEGMRSDVNNGVVSEDLISSLDLGPTTLNLAGIQIPDYMQGQPFLGDDVPEPRTYVYGHRDRMDERYDIIRMVRDKRFKYLCNYEPWKPYDQFMNSAEKSAIKQELHRLAEEDNLPDGAQWVTAESKPVEELYDCDNDPHELHNLANDPAYVATLKRMRAVHAEWMVATRDLGLIPEPHLVELEAKFGNRYAIMPGLVRESNDFRADLRRVAIAAAQPNAADVKALQEWLKSDYPSIRYWAAVGLGNLGGDNSAAKNALLSAAYDKDAAVRVASAGALLIAGVRDDDMREVLRDALASEAEWVRLHAALALDAAGEKARPLVPALQEALKDTQNKYVVRVANHAVNELLGTENEVR
jgi:N-sulfoglucosamine sulfohydrolase